jgi:hypothetical protein
MSCRAALVLPALLASCGWSSQEEQVLERFFRASRERDRTVLADVSSVILEPRTDGTVLLFDVESTGQEAQRPFDREKDTAVAVLSLTPPGQPDFDLSAVTVDLIGKDLVVDTDFRTPGGEESRRTMTVTLQRAVARRGEHGVQGRWIVTAFR